ncbi:phytoene dehydrogenase-like protein [Catenuloplanes nepalensis]|uniref:Phytoene dehydrogenase-like protein n=1 Tax=Catenuloplanes nepalensis TaxID=587533 RepID=A0ABT9MZ33_9ACTN|nr:hypothetical protein [Catenuloplanes nepalensis]MDP9796703.1 phytoene dehydrogenase-like protein [Catenuloplanes nepalensis]
MRWTSVLLVGAATIALAACGTAPGSPAAVPAVPGTAAAVPKSANVADALEVVNAQFAAVNAGDWAKAWDAWTDAAKDEIAKDVYVKTNEACPALKKAVFELERVTPVDDTTVDVGWRRDGISEHGTSRLAGTGWRFDPGSTLVEYAGGADAAIAKRKEAGECN